jgi:hypothetical protein
VNRCRDQSRAWPRVASAHQRSPVRAAPKAAPYPHRNTVVDTHVHEGEFQVYGLTGEPLTTIPKTTTKEVTLQGLRLD